MNTIETSARTELTPQECVVAFKRALELYPKQAKKRRVADWYRVPIAVEVEIEKGRVDDSVGAKVYSVTNLLCEVRCLIWDRGLEREVLIEVLYGYMRGTLGGAFGMGGLNEAETLRELTVRPFRSAGNQSLDADWPAASESSDIDSSQIDGGRASENYGFPEGQAW